MKLVTGGREILRYLAVHMRLPIQRTQRFKIILGVTSRPRKAVAAMDITCLPLAQRTFGIVNARLRNRAEDCMAPQAKSCNDGENERRDNLSRKFAGRAFPY